MERDTTGILMWDEIFLVETPSGREVAVALVDTQVVFFSQNYLQTEMLINLMLIVVPLAPRLPTHQQTNINQSYRKLADNII